MPHDEKVIRGLTGEEEEEEEEEDKEKRQLQRGTDTAQHSSTSR